MTTFTDQLAYDVINVFCNTGEWGETTGFEQAGMASSALSVAALWGSPELAELAEGFVADTCRVWAPVASFTAGGQTVIPKRSRAGANTTVLIRYPTSAPDARERWEVENVRRDQGMYEFDCVRSKTLRAVG